MDFTEYEPKPIDKGYRTQVQPGAEWAQGGLSTLPAEVPIRLHPIASVHDGNGDGTWTFTPNPVDVEKAEEDLRKHMEREVRQNRPPITIIDLTNDSGMPVTLFPEMEGERELLGPNDVGYSYLKYRPDVPIDTAWKPITLNPEPFPGDPDEVLHCLECNEPYTMGSFRHFSWVAHSDFCVPCSSARLHKVIQGL